MLAHNLKNVIVLVDKDRVKSGLLAIDKWKVDTLLLDDGLQYLHLKHRLDIVLWIGRRRLVMNFSFRVARCVRRREISDAPATSLSPKKRANLMML